MQNMNFQFSKDPRVNKIGNEIVRYFFDLYKFQLGVRIETLGKVQNVKTERTGSKSDFTFELTVNHQAGEKKRRFTVSPIGDSVESQSTVFKVIYDDIMVIKIPPNPLVDFEAYLTQINSERNIGMSLKNSIKCLSPSLSIILDKFPIFKDMEKEGESKEDNDYIKHLRYRKERQSLLKIGDSFAMFMGFSTYSFFNQAVEKAHYFDDIVQKEIVHSGGFWESHALEDAYNVAYGSKMLKINEVFFKYKNLLGQTLIDFGIESKVPEYKLKDWFIQWLAQADLQYAGVGITAEFKDKHDSILNGIYEKFGPIIGAYRNTIKSYVLRKQFNQNINFFQGVIRNILELISRLYDQKIVIRDLKPDNIFIVGRLDESPLISAASLTFSLGLIDMETAVQISSDPADCPQPVLAGSPGYATPTHFFENNAIRETYGQIEDILMLQDWFAAIGIVYAVVTGKILFEKTGELTPEIIRFRLKDIKEQAPSKETLTFCNWVFWHNAVSDFKEIDEKIKKQLMKLKIELPKRFQEIMLSLTKAQLNMVKGKIKKNLYSQDWASIDQDIKVLAKAQIETLKKLSENLKTLNNGVQESTERSMLWQRNISTLIDLKKRIKTWSDVVLKLETNPVTIPVYVLLELMLGIVIGRMYNDEWSDRLPPAIF